MKTIKMYGINHYRIDDNGNISFSFLTTYNNEWELELCYKPIFTASCGTQYLCEKTSFDLTIKDYN